MSKYHPLRENLPPHLKVTWTSRESGMQRPTTPYGGRVLPPCDACPVSALEEGVAFHVIDAVGQAAVALGQVVLGAWQQHVGTLHDGSASGRPPRAERDACHLAGRSLLTPNSMQAQASNVPGDSSQ